MSVTPHCAFFIVLNRNFKTITRTTECVSPINSPPSPLAASGMGSRRVKLFLKEGAKVAAD